PGGRSADVYRRARQPGGRATGRHQADVVMLMGDAQPVLDHPRIVHEFGKIEDTAVRAKASLPLRYVESLSQAGTAYGACQQPLLALTLIIPPVCVESKLYRSS